MPPIQQVLLTLILLIGTPIFCASIVITYIIIKLKRHGNFKINF
jgi:hypothetical protein